jgi:hypothetical protein
MLSPLDHGRRLRPLGKRSNAADHPFSEIIVVFPAIEADRMVVLASLDLFRKLLHTG